MSPDPAMTRSEAGSVWQVIVPVLTSACQIDIVIASPS